MNTTLRFNELELDKVSKLVTIGYKGRYTFEMMDGQQVNVIMKNVEFDTIKDRFQAPEVSQPGLTPPAPSAPKAAQEEVRRFKAPQFGRYGSHEDVEFRDPDFIGYWCAPFELGLKLNSEGWEYATREDLVDPDRLGATLIPGETVGHGSRITKNELILLVNTRENVAKLERHWASLQSDPHEKAAEYVRRGGMQPTAAIWGKRNGPIEISTTRE